jgi:hypothetical protein
MAERIHDLDGVHPMTAEAPSNSNRRRWGGGNEIVELTAKDMFEGVRSRTHMAHVQHEKLVQVFMLMDYTDLY